MAHFRVLSSTGVLLLFSAAIGALAQQAPGEQQPAAPPPPPKIVDTGNHPDTSDGQFSFELFGWGAVARPRLRAGANFATSATSSGNLDFPRKDVAIPGAVLSVAAGKYNTLRVSYFRLQASGNTTAPGPLNVLSTGYNPGDFLNIRYTLQNVKITYDYLSYPFPPENSKLRVRLLFSAQYTTIHPKFNAPLKPTTDSLGNAVITTADATKWFIYPSLGAAVERALTKHVRLEAQASGFALPHRANIWDAEATANWRHGKVEILLGGKAFHFKMSAKTDQYMTATLPGVMLGLRWYP